MSQKPSNADILRAAIEEAEADKIDLTKSSNRKNLISRVIEQNEHLAGSEKSLQGSFSNIITARAKAKGDNPDNFRGKPRPKFDGKLASNMEPNPVAVQRPAGYSPVLETPAGQPGEQQQAPPNQFMITDKMSGETVSGLWEVLRAFDGNIEALDKDEKDSLGGLWSPLIGEYTNSKKSLFILAAGATAGTAARKIRAGRKITKAKREKEKTTEKQKEEIKQKDEKETVEKEKKEVKAEAPGEYGYPVNGEFTDYGV